MTAPTQAQIEAAAWEIVRGGGHTVPPDEARIIAKAALTAAAEVGEKYPSSLIGWQKLLKTEIAATIRAMKD